MLGHDWMKESLFPLAVREILIRFIRVNERDAETHIVIISKRMPLVMRIA